MKKNHGKSKSSQMADVGAKPVTSRIAVAMAKVIFSRPAFALLKTRGSPKGDVLETARIAGIMAAKDTARAIPFCHPLLLDKVAVAVSLEARTRSVVIKSEVKAQAKTGVEMEALHAAGVAALTVYDMMKWADKGIVISDWRLLEKHGGKSGDYFCRGAKPRTTG